MPRISEFPYKYAPSPSAFVAGVDVNENGEKINVQIPFSAFGEYKSYSYDVEYEGVTMYMLIKDLEAQGYNCYGTKQSMILTLSGALDSRIFMGYITSSAGGNAYQFELFDLANCIMYSQLETTTSTVLISTALNNARPVKYTSGGVKYVTVSEPYYTNISFADIALEIETAGGSMLGVNFVKIVEGGIDGNYLLNCAVYNGNMVSAYMLDLETLTQYSTNGATSPTNTLKDLIINRTYGSVTEVGGGLPYESVMWNNPTTDMLDKITPYVTDASKKTIIQLSGYNSALLLVSGSRWLKDGKEVWLLNATNLYNGKMLSTGAHADPTTISINDFLNSGDYEVGGGLQYEHVKWNSRDDTLDTITAVIPEMSISKKTIIYLNGCDYALLLVNGVLSSATGLWILDITNLYNGKMFHGVDIDPTTITIYDFLNSGEYEVKEFAEEEHTHSEYLTETDLDGYAKTSDIPSLDGYAKTTDLFNKSYNDLTDKPTIPSIEGLASESYVDTKVAGVVNSAPETLDTLNELSKALGDDPNFATTIANQIGNKVDRSDLKTVAFSGSYSDLTNKPTIPSLDGYAKQTYVDAKVKRVDIKTYSEGLAMEYDEQGDVYIVTGIGTCEDTEIIIPSEYNGCSVNRIAAEAFMGKERLTKVYIPDSIISIDYDAFVGCMCTIYCGAKSQHIGFFAPTWNSDDCPVIWGVSNEYYMHLLDHETRIAALEGNGSSGGSGGASIIDIEDFPSNPSTSAIYRKWQVIKAQMVDSGSIITDGTQVCEVVDTLPETGNVCYTGTSMYAYYQRADGEAYGYVEETLSASMGVPAGWYPAATLYSALGYTYKGIIDSIDKAESDGYYVLLTKKPHLYCYHNNGSAVEKAAIITNNNYEFDEETGTLTQIIVL